MSGSTVSFAKDILPLFTPGDIACMKSSQPSYPIDLTNYQQVMTNATQILEMVTGDPPQMPPGGPYWTPTQIDTFQSWINQNFPA
jgi:hypothetical protein